MNSDKSQTERDPVSFSRWRIYALMAAITLVILGTITYTLFMGNRINAKYAPLLNATMEFRLKTAQAHLWFEEVISEDPSKKVEEVLGLIDQADWYANAILNGGRNTEVVFMPIGNHSVEDHIRIARKDLAEFKKLTSQRFAIGKAAGIGSDIEQEYDAVFENFLQQADLAEKLIQLSMRKDFDRFRFSQVFLLAACLIIAVMVATLFHRLDRRKAAAVVQARKEELKAKKSEKWLHTSLESMADGVITTDPEGSITYLNPVAVSITGWNQIDAAGVEISEVFKLVHEETHEPVESPA
jgi:PAS domain-containing protein